MGQLLTLQLYMHTYSAATITFILHLSRPLNITKNIATLDGHIEIPSGKLQGQPLLRRGISPQYHLGIEHFVMVGW